jgi:2-amino-4-hydroxy-6-hydroxymethyldihydropteridine diphosphokinase
MGAILAATPETIVYLALGSNLGDRRAHIAAAVARLAPDVVVERVSSLYETEPAYVLDQPRFLNAALRGRTALDPSALLALLKRIERELGRGAGVRYGPRVIDLDILLYGDRSIATEALTIPHPRMAERPFVLVPLAEIAPGLTPPGWATTLGALAQVVRGHGDVLVRKGALTDVER